MNVSKLSLLTYSAKAEAEFLWVFAAFNSVAVPRRNRSLHPLALKMFPFNSEINIQLKSFYTFCVFQNILGSA